ncbi:MAG: DUF1565 domain-containing protein [Candidatus Saccharimonas sp.]|nr:DUF1565 domain-containing protein [Planctomycetaceae bacterium]
MKFVAARAGDDANDGSEQKPWRTIQHSVKQLQPGETLVVRGGTYHEHVVVTAVGTVEKPVTIRGYPGELAVIDGGLPEFQLSPQTAWEPCPEGVSGEFRSVKTYPGLHTRNEGVHLFGHFADSMIPLHGYRLHGDLRSDNVYWNLDNKVGKEEFIYCGPGVFYDAATGRIHVRLAHTRMKYLADEDNYTGETDPRKLSLVIGAASHGPTLSLKDCRYGRLLDLVVRGSGSTAIEIDHGEQLVLDGVTAYGAASAIRVADTAGLRVLNTACRGPSAPWTFRGSLKYRSVEARIFSASSWTPTWPGNRDFELASNEFTDSVDGVFIGNVKRVRFHHNLLDNVSDDGVFLTAGTAFDGETPGGEFEITQNRFSRCLTTFAFGVGHGRQKVLADRIQTGSGGHIARNVFDFRRPVHYYQPHAADDPQPVDSRGRLFGDHGSPAWEPVAFHHNTVLNADTPFRSGYGGGTNGGMGRAGARRVFNNIFLNTAGQPGYVLPEIVKPKPDESAAGAKSFVPDFAADGNLHWSLAPGFDATTFLGHLRRSSRTVDERAGRALGWASRDLAADPRCERVSPDWRVVCDLRLRSDSPTLRAGVALPHEWPLRFKEYSNESPCDIGAFPADATPARIGMLYRWTLFGEEVEPFLPRPVDRIAFLSPWTASPPVKPNKPAVVVSGYPAPDVPLIEYALLRQGLRTEVLEQTWLKTEDYPNYSAIAVIGDLARAKIEPHVYSPDDLKRVTSYLEQGGTLILLQRGRDLFKTPHGTEWLQQTIGFDKPVPRAKSPAHGPFGVLAQDHPWTKHLAGAAASWFATPPHATEFALKAARGERLIGDNDSHAILYRQRIGRGQLVYLGWSPAASLPATRDRASSVEHEAEFEQQMQILLHIAADVANGNVAE